MRILVFNSGSSSLRFLLSEDGRPTLRGCVTGVGEKTANFIWCDCDHDVHLTLVAGNHAEAAKRILALVGERLLSDGIVAVGHRVVLGPNSDRASLVSDDLLRSLEDVSERAPLHNPQALQVIRATQQALGGLPMVAVYDTAFFMGLPEHVRTYALPRGWARAHHVRRNGFHGIAHRYLYERYRQIAGSRGGSRVITFQLGHGCSAAAIKDGHAVETSMGYTPLEGLLMSTRGGDMDSGIILQLVTDGLPKAELHHGLNFEGGLLALSGISGDMRELLSLESRGHTGAHLAVEAFCHTARKYLGAYLATLGGADAVLFGGGIGENAPEIRARICCGMEWCGLKIDEWANQTVVAREACISAQDSKTAIHVIPVDEESVIASETRKIIEAAAVAA